MSLPAEKRDAVRRVLDAAARRLLQEQAQSGADPGGQPEVDEPRMAVRDVPER